MQIPLIHYQPPTAGGAIQRQGGSGNIQDVSPPQPGTLSVTGAAAVGLPVGIAIVLALLGAIQPFVNAFIDSRFRSRQEDARARTERMTAEAAWLKSALAIEDDNKRAIALKFLVKAGLVEDRNGIGALAVTEVPHIGLVPAPGASPSTPEISKQPPPAPTAAPGSGRGRGGS